MTVRRPRLAAPSPMALLAVPKDGPAPAPAGAGAGAGDTARCPVRTATKRAAAATPQLSSNVAGSIEAPHASVATAPGKRPRPIRYALVTSVIALCSSSLLIACTSGSRTTTASGATTTRGSADVGGSTDYALPEHWLSSPSGPRKGVDVFYLYPTTYQKTSASDPDISAIDSPSMLNGAKAAFARQAAAFEPAANTYAPYYRQADATYTLNLPIAERDQIVGGIPTSDARAALEYYIANYNDGRPFILASHSQGSQVMLNLLAGYMNENPAVYSRMIAAYVIGYSVTPEYLARNPHLKFAEGADDTGVIISYNTEAPSVTGKNPVVLPGAMAINPITWTRSEELATAQQSLGSVLYNPAGNLMTIEHYADARIDKDKGVVVCSTADVTKLSPGRPGGFPKGVFHSFDYPFYFYNIRQNAADRIDHFLNK